MFAAIRTTSPNPIGPAVGAETSSRNPAAAPSPPTRSTSTGPNRRTIASPASRATTIPAENAPRPQVEPGGEKPATWDRNTPDQSATAPSDRNASRQSAPNPAIAMVGHA